jgi:polyphosphate kinase
MSENIPAISIVDRFLEHSRILIFDNDGDEEWYLGSADWMKRNLNRRVEVVFPIYDPDIREEFRTIVELQWGDTSRSRVLGAECTNQYRTTSGPSIRAQVDTYAFVESLLGSGLDEGAALAGDRE